VKPLFLCCFFSHSHFENLAGLKDSFKKISKFVLMYLFRKKDPNRPDNINIRIMHFINAFAIIVFLAGIIYKLIDIIFLQ